MQDLFNFEQDKSPDQGTGIGDDDDDNMGDYSELNVFKCNRLLCAL